MTASVITQDFIAFARNRFRMDWDDIHGARHWSRVRYNGLLLAEHHEVGTTVIQWFAFIHDLERHNDWEDPGHGKRAAKLAGEINADFMGLSDHQLTLLQTACTGHSAGKTEADPTVMVCWDADRLDLGRVGIYPSAKYLCTEAAGEASFIEAAYERSTERMYRGDEDDTSYDIYAKNLGFDRSDY